MLTASCAVVTFAPLLCAERSARPDANVTVTRNKGMWNAVFSVKGRDTSEQDADNPFLNNRLDVIVSQGDRRYIVPGYYAADGNAAESGAESGNVWRAHFVTEATGAWSCDLRLYEGDGIALSADPARDKIVKTFSCPFGMLPAQGPSSQVPATNRKTRGLGFLRHTGGHHLRFVGRSEPSIKAGADSPENFLGYAEFDGTYRIGKLKRRSGENFAEELHRYEPHMRDWRPGDPT